MISSNYFANILEVLPQITQYCNFLPKFPYLSLKLKHNNNNDDIDSLFGFLLHIYTYNIVCCPNLYRASSSGKKLLSSKEHLYPKHICSEYQLFMNTKT